MLLLSTKINSSKPLKTFQIELKQTLQQLSERRVIKLIHATKVSHCKFVLNFEIIIKSQVIIHGADNFTK